LIFSIENHGSFGRNSSNFETLLTSKGSSCAFCKKDNSNQLAINTSLIKSEQTRGFSFVVYLSPFLYEPLYSQFLLIFQNQSFAVPFS
jgi:hypothetical protein